MIRRMAAVMLYERVHYRHDPRWLLPGQEGGQAALCLACVIEMMEDTAVSVVRKKHALSIFQIVLRRSSSNLLELLTHDGRVCTHFIGTLLAMLQNVEDGAALDLITEILVQLIAELKLEQFVHCALDECNKQLSTITCMRGALPVFSLLGKLVDSVPSLADSFVTDHYNMIEYVLQGLMYPSEAVKAAVCYLYGKLYSSVTVAEKLAAHFTDKLCGPFLATLEIAQTKELQINCLGLLKQLLSYDHFVSVIMNEPVEVSESGNTAMLQQQNPLPLVLKKLLLSREEILQIACVQCIAAILVHSTAKYAPAFIHADIPEFLFEHLLSTSEVLIWSLYCCLLLMIEERLLFSKCHTVYGIESVVRSLQGILQMNNVELHKQGLLLLTEILKRQPMEIKLFTNPGIFKATTNVLQEAVSCPILEVAIEATSASSAFLRKNHLSSPVQYKELQTLLGKILERCTELTPVIRRTSDLQARRDQLKTVTRQGQLLINALQCFLNACRLALECQSDPSAQENAFTAPSSENEDTLEDFSSFLLKICDNVCIPTALRYYEQMPAAAAMEILFSILSSVFAVVPSMEEAFARKLASASFIRLALEIKSTLCVGFRHPQLNQSCSDFLASLCCILWKAAVDGGDDSQDEVCDILQRNLLHLSGSVPESLSILLESSNAHIDKTLRCRQYSLLIIFCVAYVMEDRFVPESDLFCAVQGFLHSVQSQGDCLPALVLRAALYILAICQDKCQALNTASLNGICRMLESVSDIKLLYFHHTLFLRFFFGYSQLIEKFGHRIFDLWVLNADFSHIDEEEESSSTLDVTESKTSDHSTLIPLLHILQSNPNTMLILLDLIFSGTVESAHKVLVIVKAFLKRNDSSLVSDLLRSRILQVIQRILTENNSAGLQADKNLPLTLSLLYLVKLKSQAGKVMDGTDFKLLNHVSNLSGKCSPCSVSILQPSFNILYCILHQASAGCRMRATAMLLSNTALMELIERILELTWTDSPSELCENLCCSAWLIASSLVCFQHCYSSAVHKAFHVDVDKMLNLISFRSKEKSSLLIVSLVQLLKVLLRLSFTSSVLTVVLSEKRDQPLTAQDAALQPLNTHSVRYLQVAIQNLLIQKDPLLVQVAVGCLESLLDFLHVKNKDIALHVASQPWNRCVLFTSMSSADCFLQPGMFHLLMLFVKYEESSIVTLSDIKQILEETSKLKLTELPRSTILDLNVFLQQLHNSKTILGASEKQRVQELLQDIACVQTRGSSDDLLFRCIGEITVSLAHVAD